MSRFPTLSSAREFLKTVVTFVPVRTMYDSAAQTSLLLVPHNFVLQGHEQSVGSSLDALTSELLHVSSLLDALWMRLLIPSMLVLARDTALH